MRVMVIDTQKFCLLTKTFFWRFFSILGSLTEKFENLVGDDANYNASKMIEIFKGIDNDFSKAVCLNAAAGLIVNEKFSEFSDAYNHTRKFILSGKSYLHLEKLQNV